MIRLRQVMVGLVLFALALIAGQTPAQASITTIAQWRLGEQDPGAANGNVADSTTVDGVGGHNLTRSGSPQYTSSVAAMGSTLGIDFNPSGISGAQGYATSTPVTTVTNNFGLEGWVRADASTAASPYGSFSLFINGAGDSNGWGVYVNNDHFAGVYGGIGGVGGGFAITPGVWYDVALIRDSGVSQLYVNGAAYGSPGTATPATPVSGFSIGVDPHLLRYAIATIDEVRVFTFPSGQFNTSDLLINSVPEPSTFALGIAGLASLGVATRRKYRRA